MFSSLSNISTLDIRACFQHRRWRQKMTLILNWVYYKLTIYRYQIWCSQTHVTHQVGIVLLLVLPMDCSLPWTPVLIQQGLDCLFLGVKLSADFLVHVTLLIEEFLLFLLAVQLGHCLWKQAAMRNKILFRLRMIDR